MLGSALVITLWVQSARALSVTQLQEHLENVHSTSRTHLDTLHAEGREHIEKLHAAGKEHVDRVHGLASSSFWVLHGHAMNATIGDRKMEEHFLGAPSWASVIAVMVLLASCAVIGMIAIHLAYAKYDAWQEARYYQRLRELRDARDAPDKARKDAKKQRQEEMAEKRAERERMEREERDRIFYGRMNVKDVLPKAAKIRKGAMGRLAPSLIEPVRVGIRSNKRADGSVTGLIVVVAQTASTAMTQHCDLFIFDSEDDARAAVEIIGVQSDNEGYRGPKPFKLLQNVSAQDAQSLTDAWYPPPWEPPSFRSKGMAFEASPPKHQTYEEFKREQREQTRMSRPSSPAKPRSPSATARKLGKQIGDRLVKAGFGSSRARPDPEQTPIVSDENSQASDRIPAHDDRALEPDDQPRAKLPGSTMLAIGIPSNAPPAAHEPHFVNLMDPAEVVQSMKKFEYAAPTCPH